MADSRRICFNFSWGGVTSNLRTGCPPSLKSDSVEELDSHPHSSSENVPHFHVVRAPDFWRMRRFWWHSPIARWGNSPKEVQRENAHFQVQLQSLSWIEEACFFSKFAFSTYFFCKNCIWDIIISSEGCELDVESLLQVHCLSWIKRGLLLLWIKVAGHGRPFAFFLKFAFGNCIRCVCYIWTQSHSVRF